MIFQIKGYNWIEKKFVSNSVLFMKLGNCVEEEQLSKRKEPADKTDSVRAATVTIKS